MSITIIAAIGKNRELGKNGNLIWNIPEDLKYFKEKTMGKTIIMGKNTFNSLPKLLPGRKHVILSDDDCFNKEIGNSVVFHDKEELMEYINNELKGEEVFIVGGASMYAMFIDICDKMYLTKIQAEDKEADVYFPKFDEDDWDAKIEKPCISGNIVAMHTWWKRKNK